MSGIGYLDSSVWTLIGGVGTFAAAGLAFNRQRLQNRFFPRGDGPPSTQRSECVFLFENEVLKPLNPEADAILGDADNDRNWQSLATHLSSRFPRFPASPAKLPAKGVTLVEPSDPSDGYHVMIERLNSTIRVEVVARNDGRLLGTASIKSAVAAEQELLLLRDITNNTPCPIWKIDRDGYEVWHNAAYQQLYRAACNRNPNRERPLFPNLSTTTAAPSRQPIAIKSQDDMAWYDVSSFQREDGRVVMAVDVGSVVMAETTQRNFVQTLAKTFAHLSTGLAIFDRQMQLVLFNPALVDLTALPVDFLSDRPNLLSFFDRLRDGQVMPEPRDYGSWRETMTNMIAAANAGGYCETWTLPSGSTYQVTGRPHPDGAVAFLFEDISAEVSLARRFRSDLELNQGILDELPDAIAVFSANGTLVVANSAYRNLWAADPEPGLGETSILDAMRAWQTRAGPNTLWGELRDFILGRENRAEWSASLTLADNTEYLCHVNPILNGSTLMKMTRISTPEKSNQPAQLRLAK